MLAKLKFIDVVYFGIFFG